MAAPANANGHRRDEKPFPHDAEAEASILGGIILRNDLLAELDTFEIDDFYIAKHRIVFEAMRNLEAAGRPIDTVTLEHQVEKAGKLDTVGGAGGAFFGELALRVPTVENIHEYARIVKQASRNRQAIIELSSALERARNWQHDPSELISEVAGQLQRIEQADSTRDARARWTVDLSTFLGDTEPDDDDSVDWVIRDIIPRGEAALWGGPMKAGKTWAAMDLLISIALGESWLGQFQNTLGEPAPVQGILLEDNERRISKRLWELCRARNITPHDSRLQRNLKISRQSLQLPDAKQRRQLVVELKRTRPALVVIDNLTRVLVGDPNSTRDAAAFARDWTSICEEAGTCVMFLHHTRKAGSGEKSSEVDPFETLRGSNDFGACARNIIVTTPLRTETEMLAEVRMRGNLDLRRNGFVMGFERVQRLDRWRAKLTDRGEIDNVKQDVRAEKKAAKERQKREEAVAENNRRRELAIHIAKTRGGVSGAAFAVQLGLSSPRGKPADLLAQMAREGILRPDRVRGYVLADAPAQEEMPATIIDKLAATVEQETAGGQP